MTPNWAPDAKDIDRLSADMVAENIDFYRHTRYRLLDPSPRMH